MAQTGRMPRVANPAAKVTACPSAIPTSKNRSGCALANPPVPVPLGIAAAVLVISWRLGSWPPAVAVTAAIVADLLVTTLTLRDAWRQPGTESTVAWVISAAGASLATLAVAHAIYLAAANSTVAGALVIRAAQTRAAV